MAGDGSLRRRFMFRPFLLETIMGISKTMMLEQAEREQKQEFLNSLMRDKAEEIYNIIEEEGYGGAEFLYILCALLVGAASTIGFTPDEIRTGVESIFQQDEVFDGVKSVIRSAN